MTPAENEVVAEVGMRVEEMVRRVSRAQAELREHGEVVMPISFFSLLKSELLGAYELLAGLPMEVEIPA